MKTRLPTIVCCPNIATTPGMPNAPLRDFIWLPTDTSEPWDRERLRQLAVAAATFLSRWRWYILDGADLQRDKVRRESNMTRSLLSIASIALTAAFALPARAQDVLPRPEQPFKGYIGRTVKQSTKDFPQEVKAPKADGKQVAQGGIERTIPFRISADETLDIGDDTGTPVSEDYQVPFKFTGALKKVAIQLTDATLSPEDEAEIRKMKAEIGLSE
jgi:hypothetical protein